MKTIKTFILLPVIAINLMFTVVWAVALALIDVTKKEGKK